MLSGGLMLCHCVHNCAHWCCAIVRASFCFALPPVKSAKRLPPSAHDSPIRNCTVSKTNLSCVLWFNSMSICTKKTFNLVNEQQCSTVSEQQCSTTSEQQCSTTQQQECSTTTQQECSTTQQQECSTTQQQECSTVQERSCSTVNKQECSTTNEQQCSTKNEQQCKAVNKQQCSTVNERVSPVKKKKNILKLIFANFLLSNVQHPMRTSVRLWMSRNVLQPNSKNVRLQCSRCATISYFKNIAYIGYLYDIGFTYDYCDDMIMIIMWYYDIGCFMIIWWQKWQWPCNRNARLETSSSVRQRCNKSAQPRTSKNAPLWMSASARQSTTPGRNSDQFT